jgi:hypothetical protein
VRMVCVPAESLTEHLWSASLEKYRYASPRRVSLVIKAWIFNSCSPGGGLMNVCRILSTQISILEVD